MLNLLFAWIINSFNMIDVYTGSLQIDGNIQSSIEFIVFSSSLIFANCFFFTYFFLVFRFSTGRRFCFFLYSSLHRYLFTFFFSKYAEKLFKPVFKFFIHVYCTQHTTHIDLFFCVPPTSVSACVVCAYIERNGASRKFRYSIHIHKPIHSHE